MNLIIETYWNRLVPIDNPTGAFKFNPVRGEYERKSRHVSRTTWDRKDWEQSVKSRHRFLGFEDGKAKFDVGTHYGIHSYQLVWLEDQPAQVPA